MGLYSSVYRLSKYQITFTWAQSIHYSCADCGRHQDISHLRQSAVSHLIRGAYLHYSSSGTGGTHARAALVTTLTTLHTGDKIKDICAQTT